MCRPTRVAGGCQDVARRADDHRTFAGRASSPRAARCADGGGHFRAAGTSATRGAARAARRAEREGGSRDFRVARRADGDRWGRDVRAAGGAGAARRSRVIGQALGCLPRGFILRVRKRPAGNDRGAQENCTHCNCGKRNCGKGHWYDRANFLHCDTFSCIFSCSAGCGAQRSTLAGSARVRAKLDNRSARLPVTSHPITV